MDRYLYERILFNLLSNAVKFTPPGGKVTAALEVSDGRLTLSVSDTGIGIPEKDQARLFEKFYQAEGSSTRRFEGTGLGLALVKEFSQLLGGDVTVKSEPGKGSTFTLTCLAPESKAPATAEPLPDRKPLVVTAPGMAPPAPGTPAGEGTGEKPKVLVAEDNPELAAFLSTLLSPLAQVRTASDGAEALELARSWAPDLVLSDVMMPRVDGIQLTRELKGNPETANLPVVLLTAMTNRESLLKGWEAGADDYLFKPFHPKELEARVRSILSGLEWRRKGEAYRRQRDALEHFTHIASHDLREPLRKITTYVDLFRSEYPGFGGEPERYLSTISRSAERMMRLLDALIEYTRLDHPQGPWEETSLERVAREALEGLDLQRVGAEVSLGPLPSLPAQAGLLGVVFSNLIGNALKFRKEGRPPRVRVEAAQRGFEWVVSVSDNGIGFDPEMADRIFILFERLHGQEAYQGQGMGLAICRKIIENHGGRIWAESKPGEGSTFYFTLPVNRTPVAAPLPGPSPVPHMPS
jgi:signal transduction histidine kinase